MSDTDAGSRARRRITRRLIPFLFVLYLVAFLDRVNVSFAALQMTDELGMTPREFGFGAGIFFLGYVLLEIPCAVLVESWSARKLLARIMVTWGLLAACTGLIQSSGQFFVIRFFLGMAEAGFFPGVLVYLSHWYRDEDRAKAVAMFMAAIPVSELVGAPVSGLLMRIDWLGMAGWRWLLILEGLPAVALGVIAYFYLTDRPAQAKWLAADEREWIEGELARSRSKHDAAHSVNVWNGLRDGRVLLLTVAYFFSTNANYGVLIWLPKILKSVSGAGDLAVTAMSAAPFVVAVPFGLWLSFRSDRTGERKWHGALVSAAGALALASLPFALTNAWAAVPLFAVAVTGIYSQKGPFWAIATTLLAGRAKAASVGLINSLGNLGGFVGPYTVGHLMTRSSTYAEGLAYLAFCLASCAALIFVAGRSAERSARAAADQRWMRAEPPPANART